MLKYVLPLLLFLISPVYAYDTIKLSNEINDITLGNDIQLDSITYHYDGSNYWDRFKGLDNPTITEYRGLYRLVSKHIRRLVNKCYYKELDIYWRSSYLCPMDLERLKGEYMLAEVDCEYRWWNRTWYESLRDGGVSLKIKTMGKNCELLSIGPFEMDTEGKASWDGWRLSLSHERNSLEKFEDPDYVPDPIDEKRNIVFDINPPKRSLFKLDGWNLSGGVRINFKLDTLMNNRSAIKGYVELNKFYRRRQWLGSELELVARPFSDEYELTFVLVINI